MPLRTYIDSNVLIEFFESGKERPTELARLFHIFEQRPTLAVTSLYTLGEIRGRQARHMEWETEKALYRGLLTERGFIDVIPIDQTILIAAADLRRQANLDGRRHRLPDALHIASAMVGFCEFFLTADLRLAKGLPAILRSVPPSPEGIAGLIQVLDA